MSHIFDALQRSEVEYSGTDRSALLDATAMVRRAEHRAASKWDGAVLTGPDVTGGADLEEPLNVAGEQRAKTTSKPPSTPVLSEVASRQDAFSRFRSLQVSLSPQSRLVSLTDSGSPAAEAFRLLGVRLRNLRRDRALKKVLITSTIPQEGKSMVAANLACTLALKTKQRILILEGDVRRPSLSQMFGIGKNTGLCEWLESDRSLTDCIYHLEGPDLWILPSGSAPSNALELLQSGKLSSLMDQLTAWFDWIIIDTPPVLPLADTSVWMRLVDGILLTTRQGTTEKRQLQRGLEAIEPTKLIGALVNSSKNAAASDYYYTPATIRQND
jgi:capsular exopolysaccharide synthesis family protein